MVLVIAYAPRLGGFDGFIVSLTTSMPKRTYGSAVRKRTLWVLKGLIQFANLETTAPVSSAVSYRWLDRDTGHPKVIFQGTLTDLWQVCRAAAPAEKLTQTEVREALYALDKFLGILRDHRISTQGSPQWHFTLELWSPRTDDNLAAADRLWQAKQAQKHARGTLSPQRHESPDSERIRVYCRWYIKTYGQIKILPKLARRAIALDRLYVNVVVSTDEGVKPLSSCEEQAFNERFTSRHLLFDSTQLEDGMAIAQRHGRLMVLGYPGVGKSTFLRKLGLDAARMTEAERGCCIPVLVELKLWSQENIDLTTYLQREIYRGPVAEADDSLTTHLRQGNLLILFDGLDEVPAEKLSTCIDQIRAFVHQFDGNRWAIACRTADYCYSFPGVVELEVVGFSDQQIQRFIANWFAAETQACDQAQVTLWQALNQSRNLPIKELARTPLLLFYLCLVHEQGGVLPKSRGQIYSKILEIFLAEWPRQKNIESDPSLAPTGLSAYAKQKLLAAIAYDCFRDNQLVFSRLYLQQAIEVFVTQGPPWVRGMDPGLLLEDLESRRGLVVERFQGYFSFSHLTLQEYLAAQYVVDHSETRPVLIDHSGDRRWREVVLIAVETLDNRSLELLDPLIQRTWECLVAHPGLTQLLKSIHQCTVELFGPAPTLVQRASVTAAVSAIAAARASDVDIELAVGPAIAAPLTRASDSAMAMAQGGLAIATAGINSALAVATARALAADEDRAAEIDQVIYGASELIDQASTGQGSDQTNRAEAVQQAVTASQRQLTSLAETGQPLPKALAHWVYALPAHVVALPSPTAAPAEWLCWTHQLEQGWFSALGCDRLTLTLTVAEAQAWDTYTYRCELISRGLDAVFSQGGGQKLRDRLLRCD